MMKLQMIDGKQYFLPFSWIDVAMMMLGQDQGRAERAEHAVINGSNLRDLDGWEGWMNNCAA